MTKKWKIIITSFIIILFPLSYVTLISLGLDKQKEAYCKACQYPENRELSENALAIMEKVMKFHPWNYMNWMNKAQIQMNLKDFEGALISAKRGTELNDNYAEGLEYQAILYEYLDKPEDAKRYYIKAIEKYKERLSGDKELFLTHIELAMLYKFIGEHDNSRKHLELAKELSEPNMQDYIYQYECYLNHYLSGGMLDYLEGEMVDLYHLSIHNSHTLDSICHANGIAYSGYSTTPKDGMNVVKVQFRAIFKDKAIQIGFKEI